MKTFEEKVQFAADLLSADAQTLSIIKEDGSVLFFNDGPDGYYFDGATPEVIEAIDMARDHFYPDERVESAYPMALAYYHEDLGSCAAELVERIGYIHR